MAADSTDAADPCQVLSILCEKHSTLLKYATTSVDEANKILQETPEVTKYKDEIIYISKQLIQNIDGDKKEEEKEEDSLKIIFHLTGFGKFGNIIHNPTTHLINNLSKYISNNTDIPSNVTIASMNILHVSGINSIKQLKQIRDSNDKKSKNTIYVYLHFGVAASRNILCLEGVAYNCADFKGAPDELGWEPFNEIILKQNKTIYHEYYTTLPVDQLEAILSKQYGYNVSKSTDPGRYVCNWIFYNSLHLSLNNPSEYNMFIHVPQFDKINQDTQCKFARDLIIEIAKLLNWKHS